MPFINNEELISLSELKKPVDTIVTETVTFPPLYKQYSNSGEIIYNNGGSGNDFIAYNEKEVKAFRNSIKNHIVNYGAISSVTAGSAREFYSDNSNVMNSKAYFCNDNKIIRDHAITIVGWDDNYSRDNFTGKAKPKNNGAYICLNTYGANSFNGGYIYISYEDSLIESYLYGIKSAKKIDYDNIYQYNPTGETTSIGASGTSTGYIAEIFDKESNKNEVLTNVGVFIPIDMSLKIYVNPNGDDLSINSCELIAQTEMLAPGYHRIPVKNTNLSADKFAIVIEQNSEVNRFEFSIEVNIENSLLDTLVGHPGKSLYSSDAKKWISLSNINVDGINMKKADMTIKAFTSNGSIPDEPDSPVDPEPIEEITVNSNIYQIKGNDIYKIQHNTKFKDFKKNIITNSKSLIFYDAQHQELNDNEIIKTSSILKLSNNTEYTLIVRGDLNCDGKISLVDLSKLIAYYGDERKYKITGNILKAADMNFDDKINLVDISQMVDLYGRL